MKKKNWYKGLTATAITLAMAGAAFTVPAFAIDYDLNYGDVYVEGTESWQQNETSGPFYYVPTTSGDGSYEFVSGKYQHTDKDMSVNISQGTINNIVNAEDANEEKTAFESLKENMQTTTAVNSTVTISNGSTVGDNGTTDGTDGTTSTTDTSGDGTTAGNNTETVDAVDVTISGVNVSTDDTFLTVGNNTNANITIENSQIESGDNTIEIGTFDNVSTSQKVDTNSTVDLTLDDVTVTVDMEKNDDFSAAGMYIQDGSTVDITLVDSNKFQAEYVEEKQGDAYDEDADGYRGFNLSGIRVGGSVADWYGDANAADTVLNIQGEKDADLTLTGFGNGLNISANATTTIKDGITVNVTDTEALSSTQGGRGVLVAGGLTVTGEGTKLNVTDSNKDILNNVVGSNDKRKDEKGNYYYRICSDNDKYVNDSNSGYGIVSGGSKGITVSDNATINVSDTDSAGIYIGGGNLNVTQSNITVSDTKGNGIWFENGTHYFNVSDESKIYVHDANHGIQASNYCVTYMDISGNSSVIADQNRGSGIMNIHTKITGDSYISASQNKYHGYTNGAFEIYDSKADFNDNGYIGLNIAAVLPGSDSAIIQDSVVNANNNGGGIESNVSGAGIELRSIKLAIDNSTVISYGSDAGVCLYNTKEAPAIITVSGASVLAIEGTNYDFYDDWNTAEGHTGRDFINSGSLQADLGAMYGYYLSTDESLKGLSGLDLFLAIAKKYNNGEGINAIVTGAPNGNLKPGDKNDTQYTGPVNSKGTLLFCFDLSRDKDKGTALTYNPEDNTYTFTYTDPNTRERVEYTFRYNTAEEDLEDKGNKAYVWTPVTIINYDPLNNGPFDSLGTATDNGDNTATDVTIFGTTINLAENDMPSYESKVDTQVTTTTGADGSVTTTTTTTTSTYGWWVHVDEEGKLKVITPPDDNASQEEWDEFYSLLNYQVNEETDLLALCGNDTELAESITVYGMWTTTTEQHVETTPGEPEIPDYPEIPEYPELPDYDPPEVDIDDPDVPLVEEPEEPEEPEQPTEEIDDEETPLTPSIPDEVIDDIIAEIEDEVTPLASVPQTGAEMPAAAAALPAGVLAAAVVAMVRKIRRKG